MGRHLVVCRRPPKGMEETVTHGSEPKPAASRLESGARHRSVAPGPDPVGIPPTVHGSAVEVCPELESRGVGSRRLPVARQRTSLTFLGFMTSKNAPRSVFSERSLTS